ncbi:hypothetical protein E5288_WYG011071 [Bos mutus]|uniref:Uncharacterized protein n=1 Tax=Bos mutus TaxID=72004 RepID=A0A6B0QWR4_9CETA|nr:hypothetical protein [Bos mutus]
MARSSARKTGCPAASTKPRCLLVVAKHTPLDQIRPSLGRLSMWEMGPKAVTSLLSKGQISQARFEIRGAVDGVWMSALSPSEP